MTVLSSPRSLIGYKQSPGVSLGLCLFVGLVTLILSHFWMRQQTFPTRTTYLTPPQIQHFIFGLGEQTADGLWVRAIQDFDYCEQEVAHQTCRGEGWLYRMLDLITDLAPSFRIPYATGPLALTVIVNDYQGASKLFDKAAKAFPNDWSILYRAAYHALYEEHDKVKAAGLLEQSLKAGGPHWLAALATRLYTDGGEAALGEALLHEVESQPGTDPRFVQRLKDHLARRLPSTKAN